ncbi:GNAT family N-acetyltransferase [Aeromonas sp. NJAU223]|uniref:GNAT family N-acetyltransferase n=1 Tax=Aeromonas sp. NJAU223 TaxID=3115650 RepID=UPI003DAA0F56
MLVEFKEINLERDFELCLEARRDAYFCSFHTHDGFAEFISGYRDKIQQRQTQPGWFYSHIWADEKLVGQLEFRSFSDDAETGYVQLIYLFPDYRGTGLAAQLQAYIRHQLCIAGCRWAMLSVSRTNVRALNHYRRFGWAWLSPNPKHVQTDFYRLSLAPLDLWSYRGAASGLTGRLC